MSTCRPTVAEIDLGACARNFARLQRQVGGQQLWAVVKADAYGHGAVPVAGCLQRAGVFGLCVATASEGRELRDAGLALPILVMATLTAGGAEDPFRMVVAHGLSAAVADATTARRLAAAASSAGAAPVPCHIKVDTGMGRLGCAPGDVVELARAIAADPALSLDGLMSNLGTADAPPGDAHVAHQVQRFGEVAAALSAAGLSPKHRTLANSGALLHHPTTWSEPATTGARPGLALYGGCPGFEPVMRLATRIAAVRAQPAGSLLGYGRATVTQRPSRIGVLPLGYHDGLPRALGNRGEVSLRGRRAPIVGTISMDLTLVDVTDLPDAGVDDEVVVFGEDGEGGLRVETVAAAAGTIPHELLCRVGPRVPRRWTGDST